MRMPTAKDHEIGGGKNMYQAIYLCEHFLLTGVEKKGAAVRVFSTKEHSTIPSEPFMASKRRPVK